CQSDNLLPAPALPGSGSTVGGRTSPPLSPVPPGSRGCFSPYAASSPQARGSLGDLARVSLQHGVTERRPRLQRPRTDATVSERDGGQTRLRVDPQEGAGRTEVSEGTRGVSPPGPVRILVASDFEGQAPWIGVEPTHRWHHPGGGGEVGLGGFGERLWREQCRIQQLA